MRLRREPTLVRRLGLDAEALPRVTWDRVPFHRFAISFAWGSLDGEIDYIEARGRRPGRFAKRHLARLRAAVVERGTLVVGHNAARYDLPLLNGVLEDHDLPLLPDVQCLDTLHEFKWGGAIRNSLKARCAAAGIQLKSGSPDWDRIMQGFSDEWERMAEYNKNDVICTLQLEEDYRERGLAVPVRTWAPRKGAL